MLERMPDLRCEVKITDIEGLVPQNHLLRKIDKAVDFNRIYKMVKLYSEDNGRPSCKPIVLVKMVLLQHIYGIRSLRSTMDECGMNMAYRWFLHYNLDRPIAHQNCYGKHNRPELWIFSQDRTQGRVCVYNSCGMWHATNAAFVLGCEVTPGNVPAQCLIRFTMK